MRRVLALCSLALLAPLTLPANEFDWLVREFSRESGARQTHIRENPHRASGPAPRIPDPGSPIPGPGSRAGIYRSSANASSTP